MNINPTKMINSTDYSLLIMSMNDEPIEIGSDVSESAPTCNVASDVNAFKIKIRNKNPELTLAMDSYFDGKAEDRSIVNADSVFTKFMNIRDNSRSIPSNVSTIELRIRRELKRASYMRDENGYLFEEKYEKIIIQLHRDNRIPSMSNNGIGGVLMQL